MEEDDKRLPCHVTILDRKFKYKIQAEDEVLIRNTVKSISDKLADLKRRRSFQDNQELLTVALVQFAVDKARLEAALGDLDKDIKSLDSQLDEYIENNVK